MPEVGSSQERAAVANEDELRARAEKRAEALADGLAGLDDTGISSSIAKVDSLEEAQRGVIRSGEKEIAAEKAAAQLKLDQALAGE